GAICWSACCSVLPSDRPRANSRHAPAAPQSPSFNLIHFPDEASVRVLPNFGSHVNGLRIATTAESPRILVGAMRLRMSTRNLNEEIPQVRFLWIDKLHSPTAADVARTAHRTSAAGCHSRNLVATGMFARVGTVAHRIDGCTHCCYPI